MARRFWMTFEGPANLSPRDFGFDTLGDKTSNHKITEMADGAYMLTFASELPGPFCVIVKHPRNFPKYEWCHTRVDTEIESCNWRKRKA